MQEDTPLVVGEKFTPNWNLSITSDQYHGDKSAVSSTGLRKILKSPYSFYSHHFLDQKEEDVPAFKLGTAFHMAILEPTEFAKKFILVPKFSGTGSVAAKKEFMDAHPGSLFLTETEFRDLSGMIESVSQHRVASRILKHGTPEVSGFYRDPGTGILCKIRPDLFDSKSMTFLDVKTTTDCSMDAFSRKIWDLRYDFQMSMYCAGIAAIDGKKVDNCLFLAVEKKPPYDVALYIADEDLLQRGEIDYYIALERLKTSLSTRSWGRYQQGVKPIGLPPWALNKGVNHE